MQVANFNAFILPKLPNHTPSAFPWVRAGIDIHTMTFLPSFHILSYVPGKR